MQAKEKENTLYLVVALFILGCAIVLEYLGMLN